MRSRTSPSEYYPANETLNRATEQIDTDKYVGVIYFQSTSATVHRSGAIPNALNEYESGALSAQTHGSIWNNASAEAFILKDTPSCKQIATADVAIYLHKYTFIAHV